MRKHGEKDKLRKLFSTALIVIALVSACDPTQAVTSPSADFIASGLQYQDQAVGASLQLEYTVSVSQNGEAPVLFADVRYVKTPALIFIQETTRGLDNKPASNMVRFSYDRKTGEQKSVVLRLADGSAISGSRGYGAVMARLTSVMTMETGGMYLVSVPLRTAAAQGAVSPSTETVDGKDCWRIDIPGEKISLGDRLRFAVWLDPGIGFCPRRIQRVKTGQATPEVTVDLKEYRELGNGLWFPSQQIVTVYAANGSTASIITCAVKTISVGHAVDPVDISVAFRTGMQVWDYLEGGFVTIP